VGVVGSSTLVEVGGTRAVAGWPVSMSAEASAVTAVADWPNPGRYPCLAKAKHFSWLPGSSWPKPGPVFASIGSIASIGSRRSESCPCSAGTAKARIVVSPRHNKMIGRTLFIFRLIRFGN